MGAGFSWIVVCILWGPALVLHPPFPASQGIQMLLHTRLEHEAESGMGAVPWDPSLAGSDGEGEGRAFSDGLP